jgi:hypothetical protein
VRLWTAARYVGLDRSHSLSRRIDENSPQGRENYMNRAILPGDFRRKSKDEAVKYNLPKSDILAYSDGP